MIAGGRHVRLHFDLVLGSAEHEVAPGRASVVDDGHRRLRHVLSHSAPAHTEGWVPIVFLGTEDADRLFTGNAELRRRCASEVSLHPIDPGDGEQMAGWMGFLGGMDAEIIRLKLLPAASGLQNEDLARALCVACGGLIGEVCAVIQDSFERVLHRGGTRIETQDLWRAVDIRYVQPGTLTANPLDVLQ